MATRFGRTAARSFALMLLPAFALLAVGCTANSTLADTAMREFRRAGDLTSNLRQLASSEFSRSQSVSNTLRAFGGEFDRARRIPEILQGIPAELQRPSRGVERILEIWSREWDRAATKARQIR